MISIIPRWEWRTFGGDLSPAVTYLADKVPEAKQESDEVYLLSSRCDASVKARAGFLDVKQLEQRDCNGLEQWRPILKATFPLPAETVTQVFDVLHLPSPAFARPTYSPGRVDGGACEA